MDTQIQAVLFDMDGVIFDSEIKVIECWKDIAEKYGFGDIETPCYEALGTTREIAREIMLAHYGADFPYDAYKDEMAALFHARYGEGRLPKKKGVEELLQFLHMHNLKVALASSTRREVVTQELRDGGLLDYFDAVICGDMVARSKPEPDIFLNDAVIIPGIPEEKQVKIIKGDAKSVSIAAASILAKVTRDHMMMEYDKIYPEYGFAKHKGSGTKAHNEAILTYGPCPIHRRTYLKKLLGEEDAMQGMK